MSAFASCCRRACGLFLFAAVIHATLIVASELHDAVRDGNEDAVRSFIEKNAGSSALLNEQTPIERRTPLMAACLAGHAGIVDALLEAGADHTIGEEMDYTCAHGAGFQGKAEIFPILKKHGVDVSLFHKDGYSPLHRACWGRTARHTEAVRILVEDMGVDPQQTSASGKTCRQLTYNVATIEFLDSPSRRPPTSRPLPTKPVGTSADEMPKNILGGDLVSCSMDPITGFFRNGLCDTSGDDRGRHTICAQVTDEFLQFSAARGNDLITATPELNFPGLKVGDFWCLCLSRWLEAKEARVAVRVKLDATHVSALEHVDIETLRAFASETHQLAPDCF